MELQGKECSPASRGSRVFLSHLLLRLPVLSSLLLSAHLLLLLSLADWLSQLFPCGPGLTTLASRHIIFQFRNQNDLSLRLLILVVHFPIVIGVQRGGPSGLLPAQQRQREEMEMEGNTVDSMRKWCGVKRKS